VENGGMKELHNELHRHYGLLLGVKSPWEVNGVKLDMAGKRVEIGLEYGQGHGVSCPECGKECTIADHAPERTWRHLDTMQFETLIRARVPRSRCQEHGVKTISVSWAEPGSRFTLLFERFALDVILACRSLTQVCDLLGLDWDAVQRIMDRAVRRGLKRRELEGLTHVGIDEKSFGAGHSYISLLTDLDESRVLEVMEGCDQETAEALWQSLPEEQRRSIEAVALDMAPAFIAATQASVPQAELVHDKFHVAKHLNEAVDTVRRQEHKELLAKGDETLKSTRQLWLFNPMNFSDEQAADFEQLKFSGLKVARAWAIKELFSKVWTYCYEGAARKFFKNWFGWAARSKLKPVIKVAKMIKRHLENILTYLRHPITNAVTEGLNSKIQCIKSNARGFRSFQNCRTRILFFCGKPSLYPL
jgi:transposase